MPRFTSYGVVQGRIELSPDVAAGAKAYAKAVYADAEAQDFCGDPVVSDRPPEWAPDLEDWVPTATLADIGFQVAPDPRHELVATVGVDQHIDDIHGPVLCWVLHNDGLTFKQGRQIHKAAAGDWFIFDDRVNHGVKESKKSTVFVGWAVPLQTIR